MFATHVSIVFLQLISVIFRPFIIIIIVKMLAETRSSAVAQVLYRTRIGGNVPTKDPLMRRAFSQDFRSLCVLSASAVILSELV